MIRAGHRSSRWLHSRTEGIHLPTHLRIFRFRHIHKYVELRQSKKLCQDLAYSQVEIAEIHPVFISDPSLYLVRVFSKQYRAGIG